MSHENDIAAAKRLQDIMQAAKGAPLTPDEIARSHQHVQTTNKIFESAMSDTLIPDIWDDPENGWTYDIVYDDGSLAAMESGFGTHDEAESACQAALRFLSKQNDRKS
jgi:hypothetical protein